MKHKDSLKRIVFRRGGWEYIATEATGAMILAFLICLYALRFLAHQPGL